MDDEIDRIVPEASTLWSHISKEPLRFGSVWFRTFRKLINRFGSVRFGKIVVLVRRGSACTFRTRSGSVRFSSVQFRSGYGRSGIIVSVRFGSAGSVWFLIPS